MAKTSLVTDALKSLLNIQFGPQTYEIEKGLVRKFVEAIGDPNPRWQEVAPPTIYCALRLEELSERIKTAPCPATRFLNGGDELEYFKPARIGDTISVTGKLIDLQEREGARGKMLFTISELAYTNQKGELVCRLHKTLIRY